MVCKRCLCLKASNPCTGLQGEVTVDGRLVNSWTAYVLDFKDSFSNR